MRLAEIFKSSLATLKMNGRRTFLTMFGIIIGIASVITILSLGNGFRIQTLESLAKDEKGRANQNFYFSPTSPDIDYAKLNPFTDKILEELAKLEGVDEVKKGVSETQNLLYLGARVGNKDTRMQTVEPVEATQFNMIMGRNLMEEDGKGIKRYAVIDANAAFELFDDIEKALHQTIELEGTTYLVVGVFEPNFPGGDESANALLGPGLNETAQIAIPAKTHETLNPQNNISFEMTAYFKPEADMKKVSRDISEYLKKNGPERDKGEYTYYDSSEMMKAIGEQLNMITYFIGSVAGISLFIAGVGVMNMMYISVSERTREIGIRRALGSTQGAIQTQFLLEGISITTLGGLVGYGLGVLIAIFVGNFLPFKAHLDVPTALLSVGISVVIGITFSVFPARAAARKNLVEILR